MSDKLVKVPDRQLKANTSSPRGKIEIAPISTTEDFWQTQIVAIDRLQKI